MINQGYADTPTALARENAVVAALRNAHRDRLQRNLSNPLTESSHIGQVWHRLRTLVGLQDGTN